MAILYLHGFASGPRSKKGVRVRGALCEEGHRDHAPEPARPFVRAPAAVGDDRHRMRRDRRRDVTEPDRADRPIGSSLGGLTAARVAERDARVNARRPARAGVSARRTAGARRSARPRGRTGARPAGAMSTTTRPARRRESTSGSSRTSSGSTSAIPKVRRPDPDPARRGRRRRSDRAVAHLCRDPARTSGSSSSPMATSWSRHSRRCSPRPSRSLTVCGHSVTITL